MPVDLRVSERDWLRLRRHFLSSFRSPTAPETGALAVLGEYEAGGRRQFTVAEVLVPGPGDLKVATNGSLVLDSSFIRRAHLTMRSRGLAGIATFHTHPGATARVGFSLYDDQQDPLLIDNLREIEPRTQLVSVVAGSDSQCGRVFSAEASGHPMIRLTIVGDRLAFLSLTGEPTPPPPQPSALFDRGLPLTGSGALSTLAGMTVAVVGASGTGSLVCELLARAGCKRILLIDHDVVQDVNLNRILYATRDDASRGVPKVEVLRRAIDRLGIGCDIDPVRASILDTEVLRRVLDADLVFGCVDRGLPRHLLCEVSAQYLLPYIDIGSEIGGDERGIVSLDSRVSYVAPGRHCLLCTGVVSPRQLRFESLTAEARENEIALGYSDDLVIDKPAVMDLNMRAASSGMLLLRHLLQPFLLDPFPVTLSENAVTYTTIPVSVARAAAPMCRTCQANPSYGFGHCGSRNGFDTATVRAIMGTDAVPLPEPADEDRSKGRPRSPHFLRRAVSALARLRGRKACWPNSEVFAHAAR